MKAKVSICLICIPLLPFTAPAKDDEVTSRLKTLTSNYETRITRELAPIHKAHLDELGALEQKYTRAANLDAAIQIRQEYDRIKAWQDSIITTLRPSPDPKGQNLALAIWLPGKTYKFTGTVKSRTATTLEFSQGHVMYSPAGNPPKKYSYTITGKTELTVYGQQPWKIELRSNFKGGTFESTKGKYKLEYTGEN